MHICHLSCKPCTWCACVQPAEAEILEEAIPGPALTVDGVARQHRPPTDRAVVGNPQVMVPSPPPMQIISAVKEKDVEYMDHTPEDERDFERHPFECPICFRFGDHILKTRCCRQYICHSCALRLRLGFARSSCPHCRQQPLILIDPHPESPVRCYRDSPRFSRRLLKLTCSDCSPPKENESPQGKAVRRSHRERATPGCEDMCQLTRPFGGHGRTSTDHQSRGTGLRDRGDLLRPEEAAEGLRLGLRPQPIRHGGPPYN